MGNSFGVRLLGIFLFLLFIIVYFLEGFFELFGIGLDDYLYLVLPGLEFGQISTIKGGRFVELNGVDSRGWAL